MFPFPFNFHFAYGNVVPRRGSSPVHVPSGSRNHVHTRRNRGVVFPFQRIGRTSQSRVRFTRIEPKQGGLLHEGEKVKENEVEPRIGQAVQNEKEEACREPHEPIEPDENGEPRIEKPARVNHASPSPIIRGERTSKIRIHGPFSKTYGSISDFRHHVFPIEANCIELLQVARYN